MPVNETFEPIERSIPPETIRRVVPQARIPTKEICCRMFCQFAQVKKTSEPTVVTIQMTRMTLARTSFPWNARRRPVPLAGDSPRSKTRVRKPPPVLPAWSRSAMTPRGYSATCEGYNFLLARLICEQLADNRALAHDQDSVGEGEEFLGLG